MPWTAEGPSFGFGPSGDTWLPQPPVYAELAVDQQDGVPGSTLELYRTLLRLRRERDLAAGSIAQVEAPEGVLAYIVTSPSGMRTGLVLNESPEPVDLPLAGELLVHSAADGETSADVSGDLSAGLAGDSAAWLALD
jgi:alpha-glucosidase